MSTIFWMLFSFLRSTLLTRAALQAENLALRHQLPPESTFSFTGIPSEPLIVLSGSAYPSFGITGVILVFNEHGLRRTLRLYFDY